MADVRIVDVDDEHQLVDVRGDVGQVDHDLLIVAVARAGQVIALMDDCAAGMHEIAEIDAAGLDVIADDAPIRAAQDDRCVAVNVLRLGREPSALLFDLVPAQTDHDSLEARFTRLHERNLLSLLQIHRHAIPSYY